MEHSARGPCLCSVLRRLALHRGASSMTAYARLSHTGWHEPFTSTLLKDVVESHKRVVLDGMRMTHLPCWLWALQKFCSISEYSVECCFM